MRSLGASWCQPAWPPPPPPGPAWSCPQPLLVPSQALCRDRQALLHTWELQRQLSCPRGWPQRPRLPVVRVGHPMLGAREGEARPFPRLSALRRRPAVPVPSFLLAPPPRPSLSPVTRWEAGEAGASAAERLLSQAQRWFSFLCYIWSLRSQECLPRGENPEGASSR